MELSVREATDMLYDEFDRLPYTVHEPLGNAGTDRKIRNLIFACIHENLPRTDCESAMNSIINSFPFDGNDIVSIRELIKIYYAAKELLDSGAYQFR